jgi:hypothetical protein
LANSTLIAIAEFRREVNRSFVADLDSRPDFYPVIGFVGEQIPDAVAPGGGALRGGPAGFVRALFFRP